MMGCCFGTPHEEHPQSIPNTKISTQVLDPWECLVLLSLAFWGDLESQALFWISWYPFDGYNLVESFGWACKRSSSTWGSNKEGKEVFLQEILLFPCHALCGKVIRREKEVFFVIRQSGGFKFNRRILILLICEFSKWVQPSGVSGTSTDELLSRSLGTSTTGESTEELFPTGRILPAPKLRIYTFAELKSATRNFKPDSVLGEGGFGRVFKGWVDEKNLNPSKMGHGMVVAVKKLNPESLQGLEEWQSEINFLGRLSHPNLVKLLGYCWEETELLLVYEFMRKGSLENHLFRRGAAYEPLPWALRLKIAIGAARGLAFLHSSEKQIIYRDFKASNILLDSDYNAKLSDFGLAKLGPTGGNSHVTTRVVGTYGYAAPEYVATGHLYVKSDVYGFGVVLLEMLSGKRALDTNRPSGQHNLIEWAKPRLADRRKLAQLIDQRMEGLYPSKTASQAAQLTLKCLASDPKSRPSMQEVLETLERMATVSTKTNAKRASGSRPMSRNHD